MASFGDFSSLLQLGVGIGIGLSLFRAPVDLRVVKLSRVMEAELVALRGVDTAFGRKKRRDIQDLRLRFTEAREDLDRLMMPFMIAAVMGAALNIVGLIGSTLASDEELKNWQSILLLFISVGWFLLELLVLEGLARWRLGTFQADLRKIRNTRAPPIQLG